MDSEGNALMRKMAAVVAALGVCVGTKTRARKHGYRPEARRHVERYLLAVLGVHAEDMARSQGYARSTVYRSIQLGREIVRDNARLLGVTPDDLFDRC